MNEKEKFEDIIESKFSEAEFPFDEANWDGAEEMISSFRKKEKRRRLGFIFLSGILLGIAIMFPFINKENDKFKNETKPNNLIAELAKKQGEEIDQTNLTAEESIKNTKSTFNNDQVDVSVEAQENVDVQKNNTVELNSNKGSSVEATSAVLAEKEVNGGSENTNRSTRRRKSRSAIVSSTANNQHNTIGSPKDTDAKNKSSLSASTTGKLTTNNELDSFKKLDVELVSIAKLENTEIKMKDSVPLVEHLKDLEKIANSNKRMPMLPWSLSANIGGNYVSNFGFNPIQGLEISKAISPNFEIGTGAYYTYLSIHSGGVKAITTHTDYDFGYQSDVTEIKTNKLHYVVIPVYGTYHVNDKNAFIAGANVFALFTSSNSVTTYKESYGEKQSVVSKKASGYSNGINNYDIGLFAGYKRHLFGNFGAALYFNYGLKDIKKNEYYDENKFERNVSGQFMLTYKL